MNTPSFHLVRRSASLLLGVLSGFCFVTSFAQGAAPAPVPPPPSARDDMDAIDPGPFVVAPTADSAGSQPAKPPAEEVIVLTGCYFGGENQDRGYVAASTLAGTRIGVKIARPRMEVVFVLDTTSSMSAMIEGAKRKIWAVASRLKSAQPTPEIRFGLVAYRDRGDDYVTKSFPLTQDLDGLYRELMALRAEGGGDSPEAVNQALAKAINGMKWSRDKDVLRTIFLVGDAPPHTDYPRDVQWPQLAKKAMARDILINGLQCGSDPDMKKVWQEVAALTGGASTAIIGDHPTRALDTKFDRQIVEVNRALGETVIPYGSVAEKSGLGRSRALVEAMTAESVADRASYLNQTGAGTVATGGGDLVAEVIAGHLTIEHLKPALLDPAWAAKPPAERAVQIQAQVERRRQLLAELAELISRRDRAVAEILATAKNDDEVIQLSPFEVVADQARAKGFQIGHRKP